MPDENSEQLAVVPAVSTGPRSTQGKARAARNSLKHGLTALSVVLPDEDRLLWDAWRECFWRELLPVGSLEELFAHRIAAAAWRLMRVERLEGGFGLQTVGEAIESAQATIDEAEAGPAGDRLHARRSDWLSGLGQLSRHESHIERSLAFSIRTLFFLQERRLGPADVDVDLDGELMEPPADSAPVG